MSHIFCILFLGILPLLVGAFMGGKFFGILHSRKHLYSTLRHKDSLAEYGVLGQNYVSSEFGGMAPYLLDSSIAVENPRIVV